VKGLKNMNHYLMNKSSIVWSAFVLLIHSLFAVHGEAGLLDVTLYRDGKKVGNMSVSLLKFLTNAGQTIGICLKGAKPSRKEIL
jgi:hypothetical protein